MNITSIGAIISYLARKQGREKKGTGMKNIPRGFNPDMSQTTRRRPQRARISGWTILAIGVTRIALVAVLLTALVGWAL